MFEVQCDDVCVIWAAFGLQFIECFNCVNIFL